MGLQLFENRCFIGDDWYCPECGRYHSGKKVKKIKEGAILRICKCGYKGEWDIDSFSETNVPSVLRNADEMLKERFPWKEKEEREFLLNIEQAKSGK